MMGIGLPTYLGAFVLAIGLLVVVHEYGHYLVARRCGVRVLRFCFGFGRPIWSVRAGRDQTEWAVALFPLGGYVKMLDEREGEVAPEERHRAFNRQPVSRRIAIVSAGPIANLLLAILLYWIVFVMGQPALRPLLEAPPSGSPAAVAGLLAGDEILTVNQTPVPTWEALRWQVVQHADKNEAVRIVVRRGSDEYRLDLMPGLLGQELPPDLMSQLGLSPKRLRLAPVVDSVQSGSPAGLAGLQAGDRIVAVDGQPVSEWREVVVAVRAAPDRRLMVDVARAGGERRLQIIPEPVGEGEKRFGRMGASVRPDEAQWRALTVVDRLSVGPALLKAFRQTWETATFTLRSFGRMLVGDLSLKNLSGPIAIADYAGQSAHLGMAPYLKFLALVSISLGVLNLLPIPLLDGGHLMYYMAELIWRKPLPERVMEIGQQIGLAFLLLLMGFAFTNDILRLISG